MAAMNTFQRSRGVWLLVLTPGLWLLVFFLVPCLIVLKISLSQTALAQPPYTPVFDWTEGWAGLTAFLCCALDRATTRRLPPTPSISPPISRAWRSPRLRRSCCC